MNDVFVVVEAYPVHSGLTAWRGDDPTVLVMGADDPSLLAAWLRFYPVDSVTLVYRPAVARQARFAATLASGAVSAVPVAHVTHRASALAAVLACSAVAPRREPLVAKIEQLERVLTTSRSGVVLRSLSGLNDPSPGLGRHLASLLPWGGVSVVQFTPEVHFSRESKAGTGSADYWLQAWRVTEGDCPLVGPLQSATVERPVIDVRAEYGSRGREFALLGWPTDVREPFGRCPVCAADCLRPVCPVCHVHVLNQESVA
ncbi:hypothetical protein [Cutibacterium sp. V947]|uniref:hypothetical protein n=1 Tax=Cutibacterium sp. V947 TaxID=3446480 RepID=UPI003EE3A7A4